MKTEAQVRQYRDDIATRIKELYADPDPRSAEVALMFMQRLNVLNWVLES